MSSNPADNLVKIIDKIYIHIAGPFGQLVCEESMEAWKNSDTPYTTQKIGLYVEMLMEELFDADQRQEFITQLGKNQAVAHIIAIKQFIQSNS